jgi:hypothetical protein
MLFTFIRLDANRMEVLQHSWYDLQIYCIGYRWHFGQ